MTESRSTVRPSQTASLARVLPRGGASFGTSWLSVVSSTGGTEQDKRQSDCLETDRQVVRTSAAADVLIPCMDPPADATQAHPWADEAHRRTCRRICSESQADAADALARAATAGE